MTGGVKQYFPGGNSPKGFFSYYDNILPQNEAERIFCIKGGPGTGKSTMMKDIGDYYNRKGEDVEYFLCSSDPGSLDGVLLKERGIAVIDGTAPHVVDPGNPGAVDEIINLGECWNENKIRRHRNEIMKYGKEISECFANAYGYLKCASAHYDMMSAFVKSAVDYRAVTGKLEGLLPGLQRSTFLGKRRKLFAGAITPEGVKSTLDSLVENVERLVVLETPLGFRPESALHMLADKLVDAGCSVEEFYCPIDPGVKLEHVVCNDAGIAVITGNSYHGDQIRKMRGEVITVLPEAGNQVLGVQYEKAMISAEGDISDAVIMLGKAKHIHDELEKLYIESMDFERLNEVKNTIIDKIEN